MPLIRTEPSFKCDMLLSLFFCLCSLVYALQSFGVYEYFSSHKASFSNFGNMRIIGLITMFSTQFNHPTPVSAFILYFIPANSAVAIWIVIVIAAGILFWLRAIS